MADRQEMDALFIDALYDELDDDRRAHLEAHLSEHAGERRELDALRATRARLREANLAMVEPPSAISAQLLQAAARRAPPSVATAVWWDRWLRPLVLHPGLAAAAAIVLVGGAAGVMYSRGLLRPAQPATAPVVARGEVPYPAAPSTAPPAAAGESTEAAGVPVGLDERQPSQTWSEYDDFVYGGTSDGAVKGEGAKPAPKRPSKKDASAALADEGARLEPRSKSERAGAEVATSTGAATTGGAAPAPSSRGAFAAPPAPPRQRAADYLELDKNVDRELQVRDLDGKLIAPAKAADSPGRDETESAAAPPMAAADSDARAQSRPASPAAAPSAAGATEAQPAWARDQHDRVAKLISAGKCREALDLATDLERRAPEYFQSKLANDRALRACRAQVEGAKRKATKSAPAK